MNSYKESAFVLDMDMIQWYSIKQTQKQSSDL